MSDLAVRNRLTMSRSGQDDYLRFSCNGHHFLCLAFENSRDRFIAHRCEIVDSPFEGEVGIYIAPCISWAEMEKPLRHIVISLPEDLYHEHVCKRNAVNAFSSFAFVHSSGGRGLAAVQLRATGDWYPSIEYLLPV